MYMYVCVRRCTAATEDVTARVEVRYAYNVNTAVGTVNTCVEHMYLGLDEHMYEHMLP